GDDFIQLRSNFAFPTAGEIESLKDAGVTVNYYYSDNPGDFGDLLDDGVDYVLTNDPAMVVGAAVDYGIVPLLPIYRGDFNADGRVDTHDFAPFLQALVDRDGFDAANPGFDADIYGDFDANGTFGLEDYAGFQQLLAGVRPLRGDYNFDGV